MRCNNLNGIKENLIIFIISTGLFFTSKVASPETNSVLTSDRISWIKNDIKKVLLDARKEEKRDDIRPRWIGENLIVVFESIGKEKDYYQELAYINLSAVGSFHVSPIIKSDKKELYASYISYVPTGTPTESVEFIFISGFELLRGKISPLTPRDINYSSLLSSLEKKKVGNIIFIRSQDKRDQLFYLKDDEGIIRGTSTTLSNEDWEPIVNRNGDCSKDKKVVFVSTIAGTDGDVYFFKLPEAATATNLLELKRLTFDNALEINPKWSPDCKSIVYSSYKDDNADIYLIRDIDVTRERIRLTTETTTYECNPTFSPDGKMIAFYSTNDGINYDLWVMDNNGGNKKKIAENVLKTDVYGPCWLSCEIPTLIYIYNTQDKIEIQNVLTGRKTLLITGDCIMSDIDSIISYHEGKILIVYSALDNRTYRKRIFIKEFDINNI